MPTYEYDCPDCGGFDAWRDMADRNKPAACPVCQSLAPRVWATAPRLGCLSSSDRRAHETNERARHAPRSSRDSLEGRYGGMRHPAGCGCCSGSVRDSKTVAVANGAKTFMGKRPWMISH